MPQPDPPRSDSPRPPSRRDFLKSTSFALAAAAAGPLAGPRQARAAARRAGDRGNTLPGRIVLYRDSRMGGEQSTIDKLAAADAVAHGVRLLTGLADTGTAFESLFPGLVDASTIAIKVNCIGPTDTRWEVVRGVVAGLAAMRGGTFDLGNVTIYDRHSLAAHGYDVAELTFGGTHPVLSSQSSWSSGYYVYGSHQLSPHPLACDYLINMPVLKSHSDSNNQLTMACKNHYGSCYPASLCGNTTGMLTVNADPNIKEKTALVLMDALRATFTGGPGEVPQEWLGYPERTPNTLFLSTDPITNEYWGRETINAERLLHGYAAKPCPWIEEGASSYALGVAEPTAMDVVAYDAADVPEQPPLDGRLLLAPGTPNPCRDDTLLRFQIESPARVRLSIRDAAGRHVRRLTDRTYPAGIGRVRWDTRDDRGRWVAAGVYFACLEAGDRRRQRRLHVVR